MTDQQSVVLRQDEMRIHLASLDPTFVPLELVANTAHAISELSAVIAAERGIAMRRQRLMLEDGDAELRPDVCIGSYLPCAGGTIWLVTIERPAPALIRDGEYYANVADHDLTDMHRFLTSPTPKGSGVLQCYITRTWHGSGNSKGSCSYRMHLQDGGRFLLYGRKMARNRTSNYRISMRDNDSSRDGPDFLGKLRATSKWGTEFVLYDAGVNPRDAERSGGGGSRGGCRRRVRRELGVVSYETNILGSKGPRKMHVGLPAVTACGEEYREFLFDELPEKFKHAQASADPAVGRQEHAGEGIAGGTNELGLTTLVNKPPTWNDELRAHTLDFRGRVTMCSVKNCQLVEAVSEGDGGGEDASVLLQFGRVQQDMFTVDYAHPFSPFQAFGVALSSFDDKLGCE